MLSLFRTARISLGFTVERASLTQVIAQSTDRRSFGSFGSRSREYRRRKSAPIGSSSKSAIAGTCVNYNFRAIKRPPPHNLSFG
jgi:hypothetical protein